MAFKINRLEGWLVILLQLKRRLCINNYHLSRLSPSLLINNITDVQALNPSLHQKQAELVVSWLILIIFNPPPILHFEASLPKKYPLTETMSNFMPSFPTYPCPNSYSMSFPAPC